jgi:hypothetical protein
LTEAFVGQHLRRPIMTRFRVLPLFLLALTCAPALADPAKPALEGDNGRYSMSTVTDGALRLDSRTGQVSLCRQRNDGWVCEATADDRAAYEKEIARLQEKVANLEAELARKPGVDLKLPSDAEVDRVMKFFEGVFRRFIGMIEGLQREHAQNRT